MRLISIFFLTFALCTTAMAQINVTGRVTDVDGATLPGVSVSIKGTTLGAITDVDGAYSMQVPNSNTTLIFSYIGFITQEVVVGNNTIINMTLKEDTKMLDEVVVVGYGTLQRKQVTSAITSIQADDLPVGVGGATILNNLQGKIGGLIIFESGNPNSEPVIQLRGMASVNAAQAPLVVIDGMPGGDIRSVVPEEIHSIDVLKDASSGAIYGTRGSGGVIMITTKKAKTGRTRLSYTGETLFQQAFGKPNLLNATDYVATYGGAKINEGHNTDWWNEALADNPMSHRHTITLQGGTEAARVQASFTYDDVQGVLRGAARKDLSGRLNADFKVLDGWLDITTRARYRQAARNQAIPDIEGIMRANPTQAVRNPESTTGWNIWTTGDGTEVNAIGEAALTTNEGLDKWFQPEVAVTLNILPVRGLSYRQNMSYELRQWEEHRFRSFQTREELLASRKGWAKLKFDKQDRVNIDGYFTYIRDFNGHNVNVVAGYNYFEWNREEFEAENYNFTNDRIKFWNIGEGTYLKTGEAAMSSNKHITQRTLGYFTRANYSYKDTYMASASIRREGSSKFSENNRWGTFWSVSAGWRLSNENFFKGVNWLNDLKLRASYGITGNEGFAADYAATMYGSDTRHLLPSGAWAMSYGVTRSVNPNLGWEETREWNLGLDFSIFKDKLYGNFDLYSRAVHGLLFNVEVPQPPNTEDKMYKNIGILDGRGWELQLGSNLIRTPTWRYSTSLNLSSNKSTMRTLWGDATYFNGQYINNWVEFFHRLEEGVTIGDFFLYRYAGVSDDGKFQIYNKDGEVILAENGKVDDRVYMKNQYPKLQIGWTHNVGYKNWSLSATLKSYIKHYIYRGVEIDYGLKNVAQGNMLYDAIEKNNHITGRPAPCDYFLYDGTFLKLQNITLGYKIPMQKYTKLVENINIYFTGNNLLTLTNYPGLNPEVNIRNTDNRQWDGGAERKNMIYPQARTFTFGLQMNF